MRVVTGLVGVVGAVAGGAVAVLAYQGASALPEPVDPTSQVGAVADSPATSVQVRYADCRPPARLVDGACVTRVERRVVVYDPPSWAGETSPAAAGPVAASSAYRHESEDEHEDDSEHEREDASRSEPEHHEGADD